MTNDNYDGPDVPGVVTDEETDSQFSVTEDGKLEKNTDDDLDFEEDLTFDG